jgi:poly(3-hydroxybutyrate) depolymerase
MINHRDNCLETHRFIYASHGSGGEGADITREKYYSLQTVSDGAKDPAIFVAASGLGGIWGLKDVPLFDDILAFVEQNACVDTSRVFVLGFSFGGMYSYSLSMTRQKTIRAGIGMSPANYNIQIPPKSHDPIAWMQSTGMSDTTCPWVQGNSTTNGSKYIAIEHGTDNGCAVPNPIPTWTSGSMLCDDFAGCKPGYPAKVCTFNGGHGLPPGSANWMWAFITQF